MDLAFEYYEILNSIKSKKERPCDPYNLSSLIRKGEVKATHKEIELKYIKGQNIFIKNKASNFSKDAKKDMKNADQIAKIGGFSNTDMILVFAG